jgi:hypothetical protein
LATYVLIAEGAHYNVSPAQFHAYALQYMECRRSFTTRAKYSPVPYFLLCRAIELELKSRHLNSKSRSQVKKQYGHNLKKAYDELQPTDKILDSTEYNVLARASEIYDIPNKGFEYVTVGDASTGLSAFPELSTLERIAERLRSLEIIT